MAEFLIHEQQREPELAAGVVDTSRAAARVSEVCQLGVAKATHEVTRVALKGDKILLCGGAADGISLATKLPEGRRGTRSRRCLVALILVKAWADRLTEHCCTGRSLLVEDRGRPYPFVCRVCGTA